MPREMKASPTPKSLGHRLSNLSIGSKLILLSLATSLIGLIATIAAIAAYDQYSMRSVIREEFSVLANVIANRSSAAVVFEDAALAQNNLGALQYRSSIVLGCIYRADSEKVGAPILLANFHVSEEQTCPPVQTPATQIMDIGRRYLEVLQPIELDNATVGVFGFAFSSACP